MGSVCQTMVQLTVLVVVVIQAGVGRGVTRHYRGDIYMAQGEGVTQPSTKQCPPSTPVYREDTDLCVADIAECSLVTWEEGGKGEKILFIFIPDTGQALYQ